MILPSTTGMLSDGASSSCLGFLMIVFRTPPSPVKSTVSSMLFCASMLSKESTHEIKQENNRTKTNGPQKYM